MNCVYKIIQKIKAGFKTRLNSNFTQFIGYYLIEYVQVALTLVFVEWISSNPMLNTIFNLLAIIVFLAMGLHYLTSRPNLDTKAETNQKFFKKGLVLSALNPLAFPFWVFNISLFYSSAEYTFIQDHFFLIGVISGTGIVLVLYGSSGRVLSKSYKKYSSQFQYFVGVIFLILAIAQFIKLVSNDLKIPIFIRTF